MSEAFTEIETALVALLRAAPELAEARTVEADVRECLFTGDKLSQGFRPEEMPAINVTAELEPARRGPLGVSEVECHIPVTVMVITKAQRKTDARAAARELQAAAETVLDGCRRSESGLGANTILTGDLVSSIVIVHEKPFHFAVGETKFEILKVVEL